MDSRYVFSALAGLFLAVAIVAVATTVIFRTSLPRRSTAAKF